MGEQCNSLVCYYAQIIIYDRMTILITDFYDLTNIAMRKYIHIKLCIHVILNTAVRSLEIIRETKLK